MLCVGDFVVALPDWHEGAHRLVPSHFPPISLFEDVANEDEYDILFAVESLTNDRLMDEIGIISLVDSKDRIFGPGTTPIMAAFTHIGMSSRFTNGEYGVYYAANALDVAIAETVHHREQFLATTNEPDTEITMRQYVNSVHAPMVDIRADEFAHLHDPDSYQESQLFAAKQRRTGQHGLHYNSVRYKGNGDGECVAVFRPKALTPTVQGCHLRYVWSGKAQRITDVLEVKRHAPESSAP